MKKRSEHLSNTKLNDDTPLELVERVLGIGPYNHALHNEIGVCSKIFDHWTEVEEWKMKLKAASPYDSYVILGYEIYLDHWIKVYFKYHYSNA